jgi:voltage-gated potassium channel
VISILFCTFISSRLYQVNLYELPKNIIKMFNLDTNLKKELWFLVRLFVLSFVGTTILFWVAEQGKNEIDNYTDVIWWWVVTSTTVGYGDITPSTNLGRIAGVIAIVIGIFGYTHTISLILEWVKKRFSQEENGVLPYKGKNHIVICEYTAYADELIHALRDYEKTKDIDRVVIGSLIETRPYPDCHFIRGVPVSPDVQIKANIEAASAIFVFENIRFTDPDVKTLHVVSRIMRKNIHAPIYVELINPEHPLLKHLPRNIIPMKSQDILHAILVNEGFDIQRYWKEK